MQQGVPHVFLIRENAVDHPVGPALESLSRWDIVSLQFPFDLTLAGALQVTAVDPLYDFRFLGDDLWLAVLASAVAQHLFILEVDDTIFHTELSPPPDIVAEGLAFCLGEAAVQCDQELTCLGEGVDVFFFKDNPDAVELECADDIQTVYRVPGEAGEGFGEDHVNAAPLAGREINFQE